MPVIIIIMIIIIIIKRLKRDISSSPAPVAKLLVASQRAFLEHVDVRSDAEYTLKHVLTSRSSDCSPAKAFKCCIMRDES